MATIDIPSLRPVYWRDGKVALLDQTRLPQEEVWLHISDYSSLIAAIQDMRIRGAPAIGVAGAFAVTLAASQLAESADEDFISRLEMAADHIRSARPTGANLAWAVRRMMVAARKASSPQCACDDLVAEAVRIQAEDEEANHRIGKLGAELVPYGSSVLTHCNAGALATGGYGTALGVIRTAWAQGRISHVFATETRPLLQGARLTAWELHRQRINVTVIPDSAAGHLIRLEKVQAVIVGADRIAANGDVANKIGTYSLAVLARENRVPFYVAAPRSTIDLSLPSGDYIPIEERPAEEVTHLGGSRTVPEGVDVLNIAFDVTPHRYVSAIVTDTGIVREPYDIGLAGVEGV